MFVRVRLPFGKPHQALLVSERAIGTDQKQKYLLTVDKENVVRYRKVTVGPLVDGLRVIEQGITPGDSIIVNGLQRARPGKPVEPTMAEAGIAASATGSSPASPVATPAAPSPAVAQQSKEGKSGKSVKN